MTTSATFAMAKARRGLMAGLLGVFVAMSTIGVSAGAAHAQWWVPWGNGNKEPPRPREPVRPPPAQLPPPGGNVYPGQQPGYRPAPGASGNICLQLEHRLVAEGQNRGANPRDAIQRIEQEVRVAERQLNQAQSQLDRGDCYEYFLFSKTLRNTPTCRTASSNAEHLRRRLSELDQQRSGLASANERRVTDDIIRELARNGCGQQYVQEARRLDQSNPFWSTEEDTGPRGGNQFGALPFATYRTICVRLCDGFYFPVSFSTLPNHFVRDEEICQQKCAAPVELYYHQNPGANVDQAVSVKSQSNYTALKTAFRFKKEYVHGCSCKQAEYQAGAGERRADAVAAPPAAPVGAVSGRLSRQPAQPAQQ